VTGRVASEISRRNKATVGQIGTMLNVPSDQVIDAVRKVATTVADLQKENKKLKVERFAGGSKSVGWMETVGEIQFNHHDFGETDPESAAGWVDAFKSVPSRAIALAVGVINGKRTFMAAASKTAVESGIDAGKMFGELIRKLGGRGGGKADFARGGLPDDLNYDDLVAKVRDQIKHVQE